jgi:SAM-dependent methyltransferase
MDRQAYAEMYELEDEHWWFRGRRRVIWALLGHADLPPAPRLLDAGCGTGRNLVEFGVLGSASGVDPSADAVAYCAERGLEHVRQAGLESLPFDDGQFDLLLACDVIEHVVDDVGALVELGRVAAEGASLVVTVPAYQWLWSEHDVQLHHLRRYTRRRLVERVTASGWRPLLTTSFNTILFPAAAAARLVAKGSARQGRTDLDRTSVHFNRALEVPFALEAAAIAHGMHLPVGVSLGMLCTKPASARS